MAASPAAIPVRERGSVKSMAAKAIPWRKARPVSRIDQNHSPLLHSQAGEALVLAARPLDD